MVLPLAPPRPVTLAGGLVPGINPLSLVKPGSPMAAPLFLTPVPGGEKKEGEEGEGAGEGGGEGGETSTGDGEDTNGPTTTPTPHPIPHMIMAGMPPGAIPMPVPGGAGLPGGIPLAPGSGGSLLASALLSGSSLMSTAISSSLSQLSHPPPGAVPLKVGGMLPPGGLVPPPVMGGNTIAASNANAQKPDEVARTIYVGSVSSKVGFWFNFRNSFYFYFYFYFYFVGLIFFFSPSSFLVFFFLSLLCFWFFPCVFWE